jgi:hypothetical protein
MKETTMIGVSQKCLISDYEASGDKGLRRIEGTVSGANGIGRWRSRDGRSASYWRMPLVVIKDLQNVNFKRPERKSIAYLDWKGMLEGLIDLDYWELNWRLIRTGGS